ncbi:MAG: ATP-binding protein [Bacteroidales bacterium]|nr:ATP-binding protein [Bacteroidales bacterium]
MANLPSTDNHSPLPSLAAFISGRIKSHFSQNRVSSGKSLQVHFHVKELSLPLQEFFRQNDLAPVEQTILLLALAPHLQADFYDQTIQSSLPQPGDFPQIGGIRGKNFRGFLPTGETVLFLLAGNDPEKRLGIQQLFSEDHFFFKNHILWLEDVPEGEPLMSGRVIMSQEYIDLLTTGILKKPRFSMDFPADLITTELEENDLVLDANTKKQIMELQNWIKHQDTLMNQWNMKRWIKPGYRVLFHGPPGTGKTLTAMILGKNTGRDVFRVDLSMVVSKYIGETEKNLSQLFNRAQNKDWLLFFDEADALFSKRTSVRDAHDKYANQEVAYLLQRIESHNGLVILASNFKSNIDEAFIRRFQSVIYFPLPSAEERLLLWKKVLPVNGGLKVPSESDLSSVAKKYEITGAGIVNVIQYCSLESLAKRTDEITLEQIKAGIEREYKKEGKVF